MGDPLVFRPPKCAPHRDRGTPCGFRCACGRRGGQTRITPCPESYGHFKLLQCNIALKAVEVPPVQATCSAWPSIPSVWATIVQNNTIRETSGETRIYVAGRKFLGYELPMYEVLPHAGLHGVDPLIVGEHARGGQSCQAGTKLFGRLPQARPPWPQVRMKWTRKARFCHTSAASIPLLRTKRTLLLCRQGEESRINLAGD